MRNCILKLHVNLGGTNRTRSGEVIFGGVRGLNSEIFVRRED
jgi:hypothetical protein